MALTPASKTLNNTTTTNIAARKLSSVQQGSQTGVPTGPLGLGTHAGGVLTFKNYTPDWVTIPNGTIVTDVTGQQVATDTTIRIPPDAIIPGVASVHATTVNVGKSGNIQAMSINKSCCFAGIYVLNASAFSGGLDNQADHSVLQSDIDGIAKPLETGLMQKAKSDIQSQLKPGEQLVDATPGCSPVVISNPGVGNSATNFTVKVSLTCSDSAYNPQTAFSQAEALLKQMASQQFGPGFILLGNIATKVQQATPGTNGNVNLVVMASGIWKYQFTAAQKLGMAQHIARATVVNAKAWLLQQTGVASVSISITGPIVVQQAGTPQFWGRYIAGKAQGDLLTAGEATFLFNNNYRVLLVHYGINPGGDYQAGAQDAMNAITASQNLCIPAGLTIYGDIEYGVTTNVDWFFGWWDTMSASAYANAGGFYCNPSTSNTTHFATPYCTAINDPRNLNLDGSFHFNPPLFVSTPRPAPGCDFDLSYYGPDEPACVPGSAVIWQYAEQCYKNATFPKGLWDQDLATDTGHSTMWGV